VEQQWKSSEEIGNCQYWYLRMAMIRKVIGIVFLAFFAIKALWNGLQIEPNDCLSAFLQPSTHGDIDSTQ
jgi:hypothetical protein